MAFDPADSALSLRVFGEDITTIAREASAKRKAKVIEGEATPEGPEAEAMADDDSPGLEDVNPAAPEEELEPAEASARSA